MPAPTDPNWFLPRDAELQEQSARNSRRRALLASIAIHGTILLALIGFGYRYRYRAVAPFNGHGSDVPQEEAGLGGLTRDRIAWQGGCERTDDSTSRQLLGVARRKMSSSEAASAVAVESDSLCRSAGRAIDALVRPLSDPRPRRLFLFAAGGRYVAIDTTLQRSTLGDLFVLDSSISRVVSRTPR